MSDCYELNVAGVTRQLPIIPISPELAIASFVILGDCELVTAAAPLLAQKLPKVDYLVTAEAKGIPLVHEVSRLLGLPYYIVARKSVKPYMAEPLVDEVVSITTQKAQTLCLDGKDALAVKGRRVAIVDDVISTGESLSAIERLLEKAGAENVAGVTRQLPIIPISPELAIASFVILGDCELVTAAAPLLAQKLPKVDYLVTAEAKGIPLVHEVSRLLGLPYYIVARKSVKPYMAEPLVDEVVSITTQKAQTLCLDGKDALAVKGRRVAIVDDVISTGESLSAIERLLEKAGAEIVAKAAILAEGEAAGRGDIIFLEELPLFPL